MTEETDPGPRVAAVYDSASDTYDDPALSFWERFGSRTVERLGIAPGASILDVCCGSGASAIPAAQRVGPGGRVVAVDLSTRLLELGRAKGRRLGLTHLEFRNGHLERLDIPDGSFDAVICVFGVFFLPDMVGAVRHLWRHTRPGGRLAITTWGSGVFEPADTIFWEAVRAQRPDLHKAFNPWDRITEPSALRQLLRDGGAGEAQVETETAWHELRTAEDWWTIVMGTGFRGTVDQMDAPTRERVRSTCLNAIAERDVRSIRTSVVYAVAGKPAAV